MNDSLLTRDEIGFEEWSVTPDPETLVPDSIARERDRDKFRSNLSTNPDAVIVSHTDVGALRKTPYGTLMRATTVLVSNKGAVSSHGKRPRLERDRALGETKSMPTIEVDGKEYSGGNLWREEEVLRHLYHEEGLEQSEIADLLGCGDSTVSKWFGKLGVETSYSANLETRFWWKAEKGEPGECWEWQACQMPDGYGSFQVDGQDDHAHRVAYRLEREEPGDEMVLHTCDNRLCVNPNHLYLGDNADNMQDMWDRERHPEPKGAGEENPNSKLTNGEVQEIKELLAAGDLTHEEIAAGYDVSRSNISLISSKETWDNE